MIYNYLVTYYEFSLRLTSIVDLVRLSSCAQFKWRTATHLLKIQMHLHHCLRLLIGRALASARLALVRIESCIVCVSARSHLMSENIQVSRGFYEFANSPHSWHVVRPLSLFGVGALHSGGWSPAPFRDRRCASTAWAALWGARVTLVGREKRIKGANKLRRIEHLSTDLNDVLRKEKNYVDL